LTQGQNFVKDNSFYEKWPMAVGGEDLLITLFFSRSISI